MSEDLARQIIAFIKKEYLDDEGQEIGTETRLISSGIIDSFSMVSLKVFLERNLNLTIPDHRATPEAFDTVGSIVRLVDDLKRA